MADLGQYLPVDAGRHFPTATRIEAIRRPRTPDESVWEIDYVQVRAGTEAEIKCHMQIDAAADWSVISERNESEGHRSETRHELGTIFGRAAAVKSFSRTYEGGEWTRQISVRELNPAEVRQVREKAEAIARRSLRPVWYKVLVRPLSFAVAWPVTGILLLGVGIYRRPRRLGQRDNRKVHAVK